MAVRRTLRGAAGVVWLLTLAVSALAADNLTLAPGLSFTDDSSDNFPVRGDHLADAEVVEGRAAVVFFGASNCWNTAREAERLVTLYPKFRDRVSFIVVDVNHPLLCAGTILILIPTLVVFYRSGRVLYARSGETADKRGDTSALEALVSKAVSG